MDPVSTWQDLVLPENALDVPNRQRRTIYLELSGREARKRLPKSRPKARKEMLRCQLHHT